MSDCSTNAWRVPGKCRHEGFVVAGKKSYCVPWGRWTNCREAGYCTREAMAAREAGGSVGEPCQEPAKSGAGASGCDARGSAGQEAESGKEPAASIKEQVIL